MIEKSHSAEDMAFDLIDEFKVIFSMYYSLKVGLAPYFLIVYSVMVIWFVTSIYRIILINSNSDVVYISDNIYYSVLSLVVLTILSIKSESCFDALKKNNHRLR